MAWVKRFVMALMVRRGQMRKGAMVKQQKTTAMLYSFRTDTVTKGRSQQRYMIVFQKTMACPTRMRRAAMNLVLRWGRRERRRAKRRRATSATLRQDCMRRKRSSMLILRVSKNWQTWQGSNFHSYWWYRKVSGRSWMYRVSQVTAAEESSSHTYTAQGTNITTYYIIHLFYLFPPYFIYFLILHIPKPYIVVSSKISWSEDGTSEGAKTKGVGRQELGVVFPFHCRKSLFESVVVGSRLQLQSHAIAVRSSLLFHVVFAQVAAMLQVATAHVVVPVWGTNCSEVLFAQFQQLLLQTPFVLLRTYLESSRLTLQTLSLSFLEVGPR